MGVPAGLTGEQRALVEKVALRGEAVAAGISAGQLRGPSVRAVFWGVYALPDPAVATRLRAALRAAAGPALLCDVTALAWFGADIPVGLRRDQEIHLWRPIEVVGPRQAGIRVHRTMLQCPPIRHQGLPCLDPIECWLQVAARASQRDLVVLADALTRRQSPITTLAAIADALVASHRRPGLAKARAALSLARERTDSVMETLTRLGLVEAGLPCPVVNFPILDDTGWPIYWLDMAYPDLLIAIEYDGRGHVGDHQQMEWDATRRRCLEDRGWRVITVTAADARNGFRDLIASVRTLLAARPA